MTQVDGFLADAASLLGPARPDARWSLQQAPVSWSGLPASGQVDVLWGRQCLPWGAQPLQLLRHGVLREVQLFRARAAAPDRGRVARLRLPAPQARPGPLTRARAFLAGGAVVRITASPGSASALDEVLARSGVLPAGARRSVGSGGGLLLPGSHRGQPVMLRAGRTGTSADPTPAGRALRRLEAAGVQRVPRIVASGAHCDIAWSVESILAGARPRGLTPRLVADVCAFCAELPRASGPPRTTAAIAVLARLLPDLADDVRRLACEADRGTAGLPATGRHGDLWSGNLLVRGGRLTGVVDWDACEVAGVPGADLVHLFATHERRRQRVSLGEWFLSRSWASDDFRRLTGSYWELSGLDPSSAQREAVALAWWLGAVAADVARTPDLARQSGWVDRNLRAVVAARAG